MMKKDELKKLDFDALKKELRETKKELFNLRLNLGGGEVKDFYILYPELLESPAQLHNPGKADQNR